VYDHRIDQQARDQRGLALDLQRQDAAVLRLVYQHEQWAAIKRRPREVEMETIQINLVLDEVQTLLSALGAGYVHPSLERCVRPLEIKLEKAERKLVGTSNTGREATS
jgi:hypothetical protein